MPDEPTDREDAAHAQAASRAAMSPTGIGAAFISEITEPSRDGWHGVVAVSDGTARVQLLLAAAGHTGFRGMPLAPEGVAALVERFAGRFPVESRLEGLQSAASEGPGLRLDRWYPDEWQAATRSPHGQT
jgi:hypothetical protein